MSASPKARDLLAGCTLALVAVPQCMAFAAMAGLPAASGLYAALGMGLLGALVSGVPRLNIGPSVTISTMVLAVLLSVAPDDRDRWPQLAAVLALLVGAFSVVAALLRVGQFARFVSHAVLVGLTAGAATLIIATQIAPLCGLEPVSSATLAGQLWQTVGDLGRTQPLALGIGIGTVVLIFLGRRLGPMFAAPLLALVLGGGLAWWLDSGPEPVLHRIGAIPRALPGSLPTWDGKLGSELVLGALAMTAVALIQTLAIAKTFAGRAGLRVDARRELFALGGANVAASLVQGFPGAGSFARSALLDLSGARSRLAGVVGAVAILGVIVIFADLAAFVPKATIAGILVATATNAVSWSELRDLLRGDRYDRAVVLTTLFGVLIVPLHWAILAGLAVSIAAFLKKVSRLHLFEMVSGTQHFREHEIDEHTGQTPITMLQVEGPLFFAQAEELEAQLGAVLERGPRVTILRMRRTQQIDFSVLATLHQLAARYLRQGGTLIICGLTPAMHARLRASALGRLLPDAHLIETTRQVFGSAHRAIQLARAQLPSGQLRELQQQVSAAAETTAAGPVESP